MIRIIYRQYMFSKIHRQFGCLLFLSLFIGCPSLAQNKKDGDNNQFYKVISFGEKIDFGNIDSSVMWTITNSKNNINITLKGNEINNYLFDQPGQYDIGFHESKKHDQECSHAMFGEKISVWVEPVKLTFDFSKVKFSEKLEKGRSYSNLIISVPVKITTKDNSIVKLPAPGMTVNGVGVALTAKPMNSEIVLGNKIQVLNYKVTGLLNQQTYLMFDFYDFNNQVQTYNFPQIIK